MFDAKYYFNLCTLINLKIKITLVMHGFLNFLTVTKLLCMSSMYYFLFISYTLHSEVC